MIKYAPKEELIENFKLFYYSLYTNKKMAEIKQELKIYLEKIEKLYDDYDKVGLTVKFIFNDVSDNRRGFISTSIQEINKNGITLPEDTERFNVFVKVNAFKNNMKIKSNDQEALFKSEMFLIEDKIESQNAKLMLDLAKKDCFDATIVNSLDLETDSVSRIRFKNSNILKY